MLELTKIQNELKAKKSQFNNFGKYYYRSCEDILEAVKPLLLKYECVCNLQDDIVIIDAERVYVKATVTIHKGEEFRQATAYAREPLNKKGMDESQITGATSSYARKYALNALFLIDDSKDADTDGDQEDAPKNPVHDAIKKLQACNNLQALQQAWNSLTQQMRENKSVLSAKDSHKQKIQGGN